MRAVVMHRRGAPEVLCYEDFPTPVAGAGDVLLLVRAATVNHTDLFHRQGRFFIQKELPHVLGMDVAGEIAALGPGVSGWSVGDRVASTFEALGRERNGAYAEYTIGSFDRISKQDFEEVLRLFAAGVFRPVVDSVLPLSEARRAHERIEAGEVCGKIVLVPDAARLPP